MKKPFFLSLIGLFGLTICLSLESCSKSTEPSPLVEQSERLAGTLGELAENSPMYLDSIAVDYTDGTLSVNIGYADPFVDVEDYTQALVEFTVSLFIKDYNSEDAAIIINSLIKEKGKLVISLSDRENHTKSYDISALRLKKLLELKPMELNFPEVRTNVCDILEERCDSYKEAYNAESAEFELIGGFAQYTLTFKSASAYSNLTQDSLRGRYQNVLRSQFDTYGACGPIIRNLLELLQIEGYRFVYEDEKETKTLKAALPWRIIIL